MVQMMKKIWKKHKREILTGICFFILFIFLIPMAINWIYEQPAIVPLFAMSWEARDVLGFYGSLLGAVIGAAAAIYVLRKTIQFTVNSQKEERKLAVRPYLETRKYHYTDFSKISSGENTVFLLISKALIVYQAEVPDDIIDKQKQIDRYRKSNLKNPLGIDLEEYVGTGYLAKNYILQIDVVNCGAGNAINVEFTLNQRPLSQAFCVTTQTPKRFICILNEDLINGDENLLEFSLKYGDISSSAMYLQTEKIWFYRGCDNKLTTSQRSGDLLTPPIELMEKKNI